MEVLNHMDVKSLAIAQPTFLPWSGWYDLVDQVDFLVLLDDVAFSKQSWQQRNRIRTPEGLSYLTVPVHTAGKLGQRICDTQTAGTAFVQKILRTVAQNYRRARFFDRYYPELCSVLERSAVTQSLSELNCGLIEWLGAQLGVTTPSVRSSQLGVGGKRGAHVAMLCEHFGAKSYISPPGAEDYLIEDRAEFDRRSIAVEIHMYEHPVYRQCFEPFEPFASALDLLLNEGDRAGDILRSGRKPARALQKHLTGRDERVDFGVRGRRTAMNIAVRVDASSSIGAGHFLRCLTLADSLKSCGWRIRFVSRHLPLEFQGMLRHRGFSLSDIGAASSGETGASQTDDAAETNRALSGVSWEWLIVDHQGLDARWETQVRRSAEHIAVIDDLADRRHDCDLLLDQNLHVDLYARYARRVPAGCRMLLGPKYAWLREEFRVVRQHVEPRDGEVKRVLIYFGGEDAENYTGHAVEAIAGLGVAGLQVDVVAGYGNLRCEELHSHCIAQGFAWHADPGRVAELMAAADLAIGDGGTPLWERCYLGVPTLAIFTAESQRQQIEAAARDGLVYAPERNGESTSFIRHHAAVLLHNRYLRTALSRAGLKALDGEGVWRVVRNLTRRNIELRTATIADADDLFNWRNDPAVRAASRIPDVLDRDTHQSWVLASVTSVDRILLIGECDRSPAGVVRFDLSGIEAEISIYLVPGTHPPGQGRSLLQCAERWLAVNRPEIARIRARVLAGNERSARLFLGAGYVIEFADYTKRISRQ
jgi:UDP-2,4-diacetamido-2,4,6-trideoxy-beta-L-altropyranose hydrolase